MTLEVGENEEGRKRHGFFPLRQPDIDFGSCRACESVSKGISFGGRREYRTIWLSAPKNRKGDVCEPCAVKMGKEGREEKEGVFFFFFPRLFYESSACYHLIRDPLI